MQLGVGLERACKKKRIERKLQKYSIQPGLWEKTPTIFNRFVGKSKFHKEEEENKEKTPTIFYATGLWENSKFHIIHNEEEENRKKTAALLLAPGPSA